MSESALMADEQFLLDYFRKAKQDRFVDIILTVSDGKISKLHYTLKADVDKSRISTKIME